MTSLRFRLIAAVSALLVATLVLGAALSAWRAYGSVQTEMHAAMDGAETVVREAFGRHGDDETPDFIADLIRSFNGQRHVRAAVVLPSGRTWMRSRPLAPDDPAPAWFAALVGVQSQSVRIPAPAPAGAALVLSTDPTDEIAEVWRQTRGAFVALLLFCGGACVAIYVIVGHALRRFGEFDLALRAIADGRYDADLTERGPPEFVRLARGFNHMAGRIREVERGNRELREQILTLQEEERAAIARDLHDEVGPYLFAINVDAADIPRLIRTGADQAVTERAGAIREATAHIQKHVRAILRQLRARDALEFGLAAAIDELVAFWSRRSPMIQFSVKADTGYGAFPRKVEEVVYRLIQESISNAVRHGHPEHIGVLVAGSGDGELLVEVSNDGAPTAEHKGAGTGLRGMAERVQALDGRIEFGPIVGGFQTRAYLPLAAPVPAEMATAP